jgi:peptide/nickel transport system ATP-binding protein
MANKGNPEMVLEARDLSVCFIIADEISTMLDVITQAQIWNALLDMVSSRNLGLLVITHNPSLAEKLGARIVPFQQLGR